MVLALNEAETAALKRFLAACEDAEMLKEGEWVLDIFEGEAPASIDMVFEADGGLRVDGAAELLYDAGEDGWYMGRRIEDEGILRAILTAAGALS